ncbi:MAG: OPT/YSL family transporter [Planctomycetes bacterium]|nr:OPT/YSL family transporter [Planctomycetota bacterium]
MVGLSLYLPFEYMIVFGIGGVTSIVVRRMKGARFAEDHGVPLAAGLIVGDAIIEVIFAIHKVGSSLGQ